MNTSFKSVRDYSKERGINEGVLIDISKTSEVIETGFKHSVCVSAHLWDVIQTTFNPWGDWSSPLLDVCVHGMLALKTYRMKGLDCRKIEYRIRWYGQKEPSVLWMYFDDSEGFTIMFPEDY